MYVYFRQSLSLNFEVKEQYISEWIYEVMVSPKIWTKNCEEFCPVVWHITKIYWPLEWNKIEGTPILKLATVKRL